MNNGRRSCNDSRLEYKQEAGAHIARWNSSAGAETGQNQTAAQFPTLYNTVEYSVFDFKQQEWHV